MLSGIQSYLEAAAAGDLKRIEKILKSGLYDALHVDSQDSVRNNFIHSIATKITSIQLIRFKLHAVRKHCTYVCRLEGSSKYRQMARSSKC